ncbi:MAG TPA: hypothetical protein P5511_10165, partial [Candidatus Goldiibacteriota bacterium]|nr:hypothetical protein [Candidatus Goldiibacteriota bacterium]
LNFPGVKGLVIIGSLGLGTSWKYGTDGQLDSFSMGLFGITMANAGIVYYFNLPAEAPAAKPAEAPAAQ